MLLSSFVLFTVMRALQLSSVECLFTKRFPMTVITLDIPHNGESSYTVHTEDGNESISVDSNVEETQNPEIFENPNKKCSSCACGANRHMKIVGGTLAERTEFPWMVALSRRGKFYCGATIITKQHLLTAAHCVDGFTAKEIKASLGEYDRSFKNETNKKLVRIKEIIRHPKFEISNFRNDIAILKLDSMVPFDTPYIQPACLPNTAHRNYTGLTATVSGWGRTGESKPPSNEVRKVEVPILSIEDCRKNSGYASSRITENMMCAGYSSGQKDSCQGDSGGPLHIAGARKGSMEVVGIVSWGRGCARPNFPGVYTRIESYMPWVNSNIDDECSCRE